MKFILIIWIVYSPYSDRALADHRGGIAAAEFESQAACTSARDEVNKAALYIKGICVPKGKP